ncbi:MAG: hypothetical protein E6147_05940 [Peptostreptococcus sp.]|uniref:hypothetical protein n=1 Tax=Peptostreptococcus sp. TaxID=1262 RepID=UPI0029096D21|nr:hypothetical protein [Peptostreptococcus sp.]MDU5350518.1 hypothetical protein [Peptostreptococcus sp.]MDU5891997.1 hypothetical protein [Peptostreptococcus sp.]
MCRKIDYLVCETDKYELPVFVGNITEVSEFLKMSVSGVRKMVDKGKRQGKEYQVVKVERSCF